MSMHAHFNTKQEYKGRKSIVAKLHDTQNMHQLLYS